MLDYKTLDYKMLDYKTLDYKTKLKLYLITKVDLIILLI